MSLESILFKSVTIKKVIGIVQKLIPFPYRHGSTFTRLYKGLLKSQFLDLKEVERQQYSKLKSLLIHCENNVPYYQEVFKNINFQVNRDFKSVSDLEKIPILTKSDIRNNFEKLKASNAKSFSPITCGTSGSTGQPLKFLIDFKHNVLCSALFERHYRWAGIDPNKTTGVFRGALINQFGKESKSLFRVDKNSVHFSTFEMDEEACLSYWNVIQNKNISYLRGYPGSLFIFATMLKKAGIETSQIKSIHTSSEVLSPENRSFIEEFFSCKIFDWYGHGERTVGAGECQEHNGLHLSHELGYSEFIKTPESQKLDRTFNLISTSLSNYSMPFLRYDTEDLVKLPNKDCTCGRPLLIEQIIGRNADIIEGPNGILVSASSFVHFWKYQLDPLVSNIDYFQVLQHELDLFEIKIKGANTENNEQAIFSQLKSLLGDTIKINFNYIEEIPVDQKWRVTINKR
jgi:phenylacetate-CoA ligase